MQKTESRIRKQDLLVQLINSLNSNEKRYFKLFNAVQSGSKKYAQLFDALTGATHYDADTLSDKLHISKKQLADDKSYLQQVLLRSLRLFKEAAVKPYNQMADAQLLLNRQFPAMAQQLLQQSLLQFQQQQLQPLEWMAHNMMLSIYSEPLATEDDPAASHLHHLNEMEKCAEHMLLVTRFERLSFMVFEAKDKRPVDVTAAHKSETKKLIKHPLLKKQFTDVQLSMQQFNLLSLLYGKIGNHALSLKITARWMALIEKQPTIDTTVYYIALCNHTASIVAMRDKKMIDEWFIKLESKHYRKLPIDQVQLEKLLVPMMYTYRIGAYVAILLYGHKLTDDMTVFARRFKDQFALLKKDLPAGHFMDAVFNSATIFFIAGDYEDCLTLLQKLFNTSTGSLHAHVWKGACMLSIMVQAQLGNYSLIPALVVNTINHIKRTKIESDVEMKVLKQFIKLAKMHNPAEREDWFRTFGQLLATLNRSTTNQIKLKRMPYEHWVKVNLPKGK